MSENSNDFMQNKNYKEIKSVVVKELQKYILDEASEIKNFEYTIYIE